VIVTLLSLIWRPTLYELGEIVQPGLVAGLKVGRFVEGSAIARNIKLPMNRAITIGVRSPGQNTLGGLASGLSQATTAMIASPKRKRSREARQNSKAAAIANMTASYPMMCGAASIVAASNTDN